MNATTCELNSAAVWIDEPRRHLRDAWCEKHGIARSELRTWFARACSGPSPRQATDTRVADLRQRMQRALRARICRPRTHGGAVQWLEIGGEGTLTFDTAAAEVAVAAARNDEERERLIELLAACRVAAEADANELARESAWFEKRISEAIAGISPPPGERPAEGTLEALEALVRHCEAYPPPGSPASAYLAWHLSDGLTEDCAATMATELAVNDPVLCLLRPRPSERAPVEVWLRYYTDALGYSEADALRLRDSTIEAVHALERALDEIDAEHGSQMALGAVGGPVSPKGAPGLEPARGKPRVATLAVATRIARNPKLLGVRLGLDSFTWRQMRAEPGIEPPQWSAMDDSDYARLREAVELKLGIVVAKEVMSDAVDVVCKENRFDSSKQWLTSLPPWDGTPRVATFLSRYMGATDTPYTRAVSEYFWTGAAGRVLQPGIKADMVVTAVGPQGCGKSSTVEAISPSPIFYVTADLADRDDNLRRRVQGRLVVELAELKGLHGRDAGAIKEFISLVSDTWVEKYQTIAQDRPRRFMFFGTCNRRDFLTDPTGSRRFLPFDVGKCDPAAVARDRDQLWAEARTLFEKHGVMWRDAERLARSEHERFSGFDELQGLIEEHVDNPQQAAAGFSDQEDNAQIESSATPAAPLQHVTVASIIMALHLAPLGGEKLPTRLQMRVADCLTRMGWAKADRTRKYSPTGKRESVWLRPKLSAEPDADAT